MDFETFLSQRVFELRKEANLSQKALGEAIGLSHKAISTLESSLGVTLLVRNARRRIELTEDGKLLYPIARRIVENCDDLSRVRVFGT